MSPNRLQEWANGMNGLGRPFLTALVTTIYNVTLLVALGTGELRVMEYITAVGPTNAMIIGFWFGERKSLYDAKKEEGGER